MDPRDIVRMMPHYKPHDSAETEPRIVLMSQMFRLALNEVQKSVIQEFSTKLSEDFLLWNFVPLWLSEKKERGLRGRRSDLEHLRRLLEELSRPTAIHSISTYLYNDGRYDEAKAFKPVIESAFDVIDKIKVEQRPEDLHLTMLSVAFRKVGIGQRKLYSALVHFLGMPEDEYFLEAVKQRVVRANRRWVTNRETGELNLSPEK